MGTTLDWTWSIGEPGPPVRCNGRVNVFDASCSRKFLPSCPFFLANIRQQNITIYLSYTTQLDCSQLYIYIREGTQLTTILWKLGLVIQLGRWICNSDIFSIPHLLSLSSTNVLSCVRMTESEVLIIWVNMFARQPWFQFHIRIQRIECHSVRSWTWAKIGHSFRFAFCI